MPVALTISPGRADHKHGVADRVIVQVDRDDGLGADHAHLLDDALAVDGIGRDDNHGRGLPAASWEVLEPAYIACAAPRMLLAEWSNCGAANVIRSE